MDTQQIDVMVADASHEVYVDTILETIRTVSYTHLTLPTTERV